jgi:hypothetical protein
MEVDTEPDMDVDVPGATPPLPVNARSGLQPSFSPQKDIGLSSLIQEVLHSEQVS